MVRRPPILALVLTAVAGTVAGGCGGGTPNPSFALTSAKAEDALSAMRAAPRPLDRPVVVIDGFMDVGFGSSAVAGRLRKLTPDPGQVVTVNLFWCGSFDDARAKIVREVDAAFPNADAGQTRAVDVVGISMGGLAARYAALHAGGPAGDDPPAGTPTTNVARPATAGRPDAPRPAGKRLRIARLFTLATPHLGASAAALPAFLATQRDMRAGSDFLAALNAPAAAADADYPVVPYARLADGMVGEANTAPPGQTPIWVPTGPLEAAHLGISGDPRLTADIARRLRGEPPFATEPRAPLPE